LVFNNRFKLNFYSTIEGFIMNIVKRTTQIGTTLFASLFDKGDAWINLSKAQLPEGVEEKDIAVGDALFLHFSGDSVHVASVTKAA
jgi:hypothetical protein